MAKNNKQIIKIINNKTVHIELPGQIHKKLRALLFLNELSMQKFFTLMAEQYTLNDSYIHNLVNERVDEIAVSFSKKIEIQLECDHNNQNEK